MKTLNFRNPSAHIHDRTALNAMIAEFVDKNGTPRRFDRGFSGEWVNLQSLMRSLGYELRLVKNTYSISKAGAVGRPKLINREEVLKRIDEILVENGREPFLRRKSA